MERVIMDRGVSVLDDKVLLFYPLSEVFVIINHTLTFKLMHKYPQNMYIWH